MAEENINWPVGDVVETDHVGDLVEEGGPQLLRRHDAVDIGEREPVVTRPVSGLNYPPPMPITRRPVRGGGLVGEADHGIGPGGGRKSWPAVVGPPYTKSRPVAFSTAAIARFIWSSIACRRAER